MTTMLADPVASSAETPASTPVPTRERLLSLDALRGFDMLWIIGGDLVVTTIYNLWQPKWMAKINEHFDHVPWQGFHFYDLIFPLFVFIVGVSLVFSLRKTIETRGRATAIRKVIIRSLILYLLGIFFYGGISGVKMLGDWHNIRLMGVLQRIALSYLGAGLIFCLLRPRWITPILVTLLAGYWALLSFVKAPGEPKVSFAEGHNIVNWVDAHYLPLYKWDGNHDPEGYLSTFPAIATCLLGVLAGLLLRDVQLNAYGKVAILLLAGAASVYVGFLWNQQFPIIKKLWTSSFVLVAGGYSAILLGLFYLIIDVWKLRFWTAPFVWIGTNAIALYLIVEGHIVDMEKLSQRFVGGNLGQSIFHSAQPLAIVVVWLALVLLLARFLYKRGVFIKV